MASSVIHQCLGGKNMLSHEIHLQVHFRSVLQVFLCNYIHLQTTLAFLRGTTMAGIRNQRVKSSSMIEVVYAVYTRNKIACQRWVGKPFKKHHFIQMGQQYESWFSGEIYDTK
jgi:hypothetical protein